MGGSDTQRKIKAVERACSIINILEEEGEQGVTELTSKLDISKGTTHTYLKTLCDEGYVERQGDKYRLSLRYLTIAENLKGRIGIYDIVRNKLDELADLTGERSQFAVPESNKAVWVYQTEGKDAIPSALEVGEYEYLHCVAIGKAMLAFFPEEQIDATMEKYGLPKMTENTITDPEKLKEELSSIKETGYATDNEERVRGIRCIATPILDDNDRVQGAISISGPARRMDDERIEEDLCNELLRTANVIEVNTQLNMT